MRLPWQARRCARNDKKQWIVISNERGKSHSISISCFLLKSISFIFSYVMVASRASATGSYHFISHRIISFYQPPDYIVLSITGLYRSLVPEVLDCGRCLRLSKAHLLNLYKPYLDA